MGVTTVTGSGFTPTTKTKSTGKAVTGRGRSPEQRAARLTEVHEPLAEAAAAAATDAGWRAWLGAAARIREYSPTNQLLILLQRPGATRVAGYRVWQSLGRQLHRGERGLTILAPVRRRPTGGGNDGSESIDSVEAAAAGESGDPTTEPGAGGAGRVLVGFTAVTVFDVAQTDGDPLPRAAGDAAGRGEAPAGLWNGLVEQVQERGFTVGGGTRRRRSGLPGTPSARWTSPRGCRRRWPAESWPTSSGTSPPTTRPGRTRPGGCGRSRPTGSHT